MRKTLLVVFIVYVSQIVSQINIVQNSGFEQYTSCPTAPAQWNKCIGWNNINMNTGAGLFGTPDYFNTCGSSNVAPPNTFAGTSSPQTGNAMMAVVLYNVPYPGYREYLSTQLACSMQPGTTYTLSFWLSNGANPISPWTIKNIGVHFSSTPLTQSGFNVINVVPQCEITTNVASSVWTQFTFTVNPTSVWNYLSFGSFRSDASNAPVQSFPNLGGNPSVYANYFVDEIKVLAPGNPLTIVSSNTNMSVCMGESVTLSAQGGGPYIWNTGSTNSAITVTPSLTTTYSVSANNACGASSAAVTITVNPLPDLTITTPNLRICQGQIANLNVSGANNFTWSTGQTGSNINVIPLSTTSYSVVGVNSQGCSNQSMVTVSVSPAPNVSVFGPANFLCAWQTGSLSATGASSYSWSSGQTTSSFSVSLPFTTSYTVVGSNAEGCSNSAVVTVSITICEGLESLTSLSQFKLYPNPVRDKLTIDFLDNLTQKSLRGLNSLGKEVFVIDLNAEVFNEGKNSIEIEVSELPAGLYFIELQGTAKTSFSKFIKEK